MWYFGSVLLLWLILLGISQIGRAAVVFLPTSMQPHGAYYFSPIIGMGILITTLSFYGWHNHFIQINSILIFMVMVTISSVIILFYKEKIFNIGALRFSIEMLVFCVLASFIVLSPTLFSESYPTFDDTYTYITHAQWLQRHPFSEAVRSITFHPHLYNVILYQFPMRMGGSFFLAWLQSLLGIAWSYEVYPLAVALALTAGALSAAGGVALIVRGGRYLPLLAGVLTAVGLNGFAFGAYSGFMPQTFGLAFFIAEASLLGGVFVRRLHAPSITLWGLFWQMLPISVLVAGTLYSYHEILPVLLAGNILYMTYIILRRILSLRVVACSLGAIIVQSAALGNVEFLYAWRNIGQVARKHVDAILGWPVNWSALEFLGFAFGLKAPNPDVWLLFSRPLNLLLIVAAAGVVISMVYAIRNDRRRIIAMMPHVGGLSVIFVFFVKLRYFSEPNFPGEFGKSFFQFKTVSWGGGAATVLCIASVILLTSPMTRTVFGRRLSLPFIMLGGLALNIMYISFQTVSIPPQRTNLVLGDYRSPFKTLLPLREMVKGIPLDTPIYLNLGGNLFNSTAWAVSYVLYDRMVFPISVDEANQIKRGSGRYNPASFVINHAGPDDASNPLLARVGKLVLETPERAVPIRFPMDNKPGFEEVGASRWKFYFNRNDKEFYYGILGDADGVKFRFTAATSEYIDVNIMVKSGGELLRTITVPLRAGKHEYVSPSIALEGRHNLGLGFELADAGKRAGKFPYEINNLKVEPVSGNDLPPSASGELMAPNSPHAQALPRIASVDGLSIPESWGTWSEGERTTFRFNGGLPTRFNLVVAAGAYAPIAGVPIKVVAGEAEQNLVLTQAPSMQTLSFSTRTPTDRITFHIPKSKTPKEMGIGSDTRRIGVGFISLEIK